MIKNLSPIRVISLLFVCLLLVNCSDDENGSNDPAEPIGSDPANPVEGDAISLTLNNQGASAYFVADQTGGDVTSLNENNSSWSLQVGQRYEITVVNSGAHPLMLRNAADEVLLGMANGGSGSFENDGEVNFFSNQSDGSFYFTVTQDLANELDDYACQVHTSSMQGSATAN